MDRLFATCGAVSALLAVAGGAFGAHALRTRLSPDLLAAFETGARYQMYHALALLLVAWVATRWSGAPIRAAGTVIFSGSLYLFALTGARAFGAATPLGGLAFLAGWLALTVGIWRG